MRSMGVKVVWDNDERTIVRYVFAKQWKWDDFYAAVDTALMMIDSVPHHTGTIFDTPMGMSIPSHLLTHVKNVISRRHERTVVIVIIAQGLYIRSLLQIATKLSRDIAQKVQAVTTIDEAREIIYRRLAEVNQSPDL